MKPRISVLITQTTLLAILALPVPVAAQNTRYKLIDIGTFGGPASYFTSRGIGPGSQVLNNRGMLAGALLPNEASIGYLACLCDLCSSFVAYALDMYKQRVRTAFL